MNMDTEVRADGISRRKLIGLSLAGGAALAFVRPERLLAAPTGSAAPRQTLVMVYLRGGADSLSILPPLADSAYQNLRPTIAVPPQAALSLDGVIGLHPAASNLYNMYNAGALAVVPACGQPTQNRSHFDCQDMMEKGTPDNTATKTGWLGRYLSASSTASDDVLRALSLSDAVPTSMRGYQAMATPDLESLNFFSWAPQGQTAAVSGMYNNWPKVPLQRAGSNALNVMSKLAPLASSSRPVGWPDGELADALWPVALLIENEFPIDAVCVNFGNWDTHDNMGRYTDTYGRIYRQIAELDAALAAFHTRLAAYRVTTATMTEFGRTAAENSSGGTDHGRGSFMLVAGANVKKGVHGTWPTLSSLDNNALYAANDYRNVLSEVLVKSIPASIPQASQAFPGLDVNPANWYGVMPDVVLPPGEISNVPAS